MASLVAEADAAEEHAAAEEEPPAKVQALEEEEEPWTLVWADEFDYTGLPHPKRWSYQVEANNWARGRAGVARAAGRACRVQRYR